MIFFGHVFVNADPGQAFENYGWAKERRRAPGPRARPVLRAVGLLRRAPVRALVHPRHEAARRPAASRATACCGSCPPSTSSRRSCCCASASTARSARRRTTRRAPGPRSEWWQVLSVFTFTQSYTGGSATLPYGQAWSLDAEVAFYLLLPLAAAHRLPPRRPRSRTPARPRQGRARRPSAASGS